MSAHTVTVIARALFSQAQSFCLCNCQMLLCKHCKINQKERQRPQINILWEWNLSRNTKLHNIRYIFFCCLEKSNICGKNCTPNTVGEYLFSNFFFLLFFFLPDKYFASPDQSCELKPMLVSTQMTHYFYCILPQIWVCRQILTKNLTYKFHENIFGCSRVRYNRQTDRHGATNVPNLTTPFSEV